MIKLELCIGHGDCKRVELNSKLELVNYLLELYRFDCIWLATSDVDNSEIVVTESLDVLLKSIMMGVIEINDTVLNIQEYETYESAYAVALAMREGSDKCYRTNEKG